MVYLDSKDHVREKIYKLSDVDLCIESICDMSENSPSGIFYFTIDKDAIHQVGQLKIKKNFLAWVGQKYGKPHYKFFDVEGQSSGTSKKVLSLESLLDKYVTYNDVSSTEARDIFLKKIDLMIF